MIKQRKFKKSVFLKLFYFRHCKEFKNRPEKKNFWKLKPWFPNKKTLLNSQINIFFVEASTIFLLFVFSLLQQLSQPFRSASVLFWPSKDDNVPARSKPTVRLPSEQLPMNSKGTYYIEMKRRVVRFSTVDSLWRFNGLE